MERRRKRKPGGGGGGRRERIKENICVDVSTWTQSIFFRSGMSSKQGHISSQTVKKMAGFVKIISWFYKYIKENPSIAYVEEVLHGSDQTDVFFFYSISELKVCLFCIVSIKMLKLT
jgi:hypothetical protein